MDKNPNISEEFEDPFGETFDKEDVVESISEIEKLANERSTTKDFSEKYKPRNKEIQKFIERDNIEEINDAEFKVFSEVHQNFEFKDFLELPKISGIKLRTPEGNYYPREIIEERKQKVVISDNIIDEHKRTTILTDYDSDGNITSIEVICRCGEKTIIHLEFEKDSENESLKQLSDKNIKQAD